MTFVPSACLPSIVVPLFFFVQQFQPLKFYQIFHLSQLLSRFAGQLTRFIVSLTLLQFAFIVHGFTVHEFFYFIHNTFSWPLFKNTPANRISNLYSSFTPNFHKAVLHNSRVLLVITEHIHCETLGSMRYCQEISEMNLMLYLIHQRKFIITILLRYDAVQVFELSESSFSHSLCEMQPNPQRRLLENMY